MTIFHQGQRVYLSGGMEYAANEGRDWRVGIQEWLELEMGCTVFNPNRESETFLRTHLPGVDFRLLKQEDPVRFQQTAAQIVDLDCRAIADRTDYVICLWDEGAIKGAGTKGELTLAKFFGKPVYTVTTEPLPAIPGWVLGCTSRFFRSFDELKEFLCR